MFFNIPNFIVLSVLINNGVSYHFHLTTLLKYTMNNKIKYIKSSL